MYDTHLHNRVFPTRERVQRLGYRVKNTEQVGNFLEFTQGGGGGGRVAIPTAGAHLF